MSFLPFLDLYHDHLIQALSKLGPILITPSQLDSIPLPSNCSYYILVQQNISISQEKVISWLDNGADKVVLPLSLARNMVGKIPTERLLLSLDVGTVTAVSDNLRSNVSGVLLEMQSLNQELISSISQFFVGSDIYVWPSSTSLLSYKSCLQGHNSSIVIPTSQLTVADSTSSQINIADAFLARITSDRLDGLYPTVVSSWTQGGKSLGLVYSSADSIKESIMTGKGVYHSRKHGLWRKGETSGATQDVVSIRLDCDQDSLEFSVIQHGSGFCHLQRSSCFGHLSGIAALEKTIMSRLHSAPEHSYTHRLFNDPDLLRSKIMEEASELCDAVSADDIAFETADLLYFALTRCVIAGVTVRDIELSLDKKAKKLSRRSGNAKSKGLSKVKIESADAGTQQLRDNSLSERDEFIRMRMADLSSISDSDRTQLLKRPVLKSEEMIAKVKPIVDEVRLRGDAALHEYTLEFDKVDLKSVLLRAPYPTNLLNISDSVRNAIDIAYSNIRRFHEAQFERSTLMVETMPGVVCSRFARPIARVGLYVPGGTAVLPSTALMLGIPAQVAGCKEIIIATPPRSNGTVSPEVLYVAKLVGASAVLIAGGAQAVAAFAYGTQSVPKVDKIFGPGNQWVTAAKMLVQNDTDALVSIDMPAGPSEVLVIADESANPSFVAADLLSQAEHGIDSQVVLIAVKLTEERLATIETEIDKQARALSRLQILKQSVRKSLIVTSNSIEEALAFSNDYAPEHLILHLKNAKEMLDKIDNAGSVFVGPFTPESCGDYASGTNHTLPTNGYARQYSGVNTHSFQKHITSQEITQAGLQKLGPTVIALADCEGLQAHANAVRVRLSYGSQKNEDY